MTYMHFTMCAQCNVIMTSEFVYIQQQQYVVIDKGTKQQFTRLRLRACVEGKSGHFELKL